MKTNSKSKTTKEENIIGTYDEGKSLPAQNAANGKQNLEIDYSKMAEEIQKICHPISFENLKAFYKL